MSKPMISVWAVLFWTSPLWFLMLVSLLTVVGDGGIGSKSTRPWPDIDKNSLCAGRARYCRGDSNFASTGIAVPEGLKAEDIVLIDRNGRVVNYEIDPVLKKYGENSPFLMKDGRHNLWGFPIMPEQAALLPRDLTVNGIANGHPAQRRTLNGYALVKSGDHYGLANIQSNTLIHPPEAAIVSAFTKIDNSITGMPDEYYVRLSEDELLIDVLYASNVKPVFHVPTDLVEDVDFVGLIGPVAVFETKDGDVMLYAQDWTQLRDTGVKLSNISFQKRTTSQGDIEFGYVDQSQPRDESGEQDFVGLGISYPEKISYPTPEALRERGLHALSAEMDGMYIVEFGSSMGTAASTKGFANKAGELLQIQPPYEKLNTCSFGARPIYCGVHTYNLAENEKNQFRDGLLPVGDFRLWGAVNRDGEAIIPIVFDRLLDIKNGMVLVRKGGLSGVLDAEGNWVLSFEDLQNYEMWTLPDGSFFEALVK